FVVIGRCGYKFSLTAERRQAGWRLAAGIGQGAPALPSAPGFELGAQIERLDLAAWSDWISGFVDLAPEAAAPVQGHLRMQVGQLAYGRLQISDVNLEAPRLAQRWQLRLAGESVAGTVSIPMPVDSGRVVAVALDRLTLDRLLQEAPVVDLAQAPFPRQTHTRVPTRFPPMHVLIEALAYGDLELGRARIETHARQDGIEIERVEIKGPHLEASGYGRWILGSERPLTEVMGRLISTDPEALLTSLGHASRFEAARAQIE